MKRLIVFFIAFFLMLSLGACHGYNNDSVEGSTMSTEEKVREVVTNNAKAKWIFMNIGGNDMKSSEATITNISKISENEYLVNGRMKMIDVYGKSWTNNFDCTVVSYDGETWIIQGDFRYKSNHWY